jgi:hypothetical protein
MISSRKKELRARLQDTRRRLGPFTVLQGGNEPYRLCDAEIARRLAEVIEILDEVLKEE